MKAFFKKVIPRLIVPVVTLILVIQVLLMTQEISWGLIINTLSGLGLWQILILVVLGFLAIVPSLYNDVLLAQWQGYHLSSQELLQRSWLINVFNLNAGFLGVISVLLRRFFYRDQAKRSIKSYLQVYLLSISAILPVVGLTLLGLSLAPHQALGFERGWLLFFAGLVGVVLLLSLAKGFQFWRGLTWRVSAAFVANAWLALVVQAFLFLSCGWVAGVHLSIVQQLIIYVIGSVIALLAMTPGTWASFDVAVLVMLNFLQVDQLTGVVWLVLYRLVFNVLPLLSAIGLLIYRLAHLVNQEYRDVPRALASTVVHWLVTLAAYGLGILLVLSGTMPNWAQRIPILTTLKPWPLTYALANQLPTVILGFLLLICARGIANRVQRAYSATLTVLLLAGVYTLFYYRHWTPVILIVLVLLAVTFSRSDLYRQQFVDSWRDRIIDTLIWGALIWSYALLALQEVRLKRAQFGPGHAWAYFHWWLLGVLSIILIVVAGLVLTRYLHGERRLLGVPYQGKRVQALLAVGDNHYTNLVYLGDKRIYYYQVDGADRAALQFRVVDNFAVVMGDPFGHEEDFEAAMQAFIEDADLLDLVPVFYEVSQPVAMLAHEFGYDFFKLGEEAEIVLADFSTAGKKMQNIRSEINQADRAGYQFRIVQPPFSPELLAQLGQVSEDWLGGRDEKGFSLGFFDANYLQRWPLAILEQDGQVVAFGTLVSSKTESQMAIDLMRFNQQAPNGAMDILLVNACHYAKEQGFKIFNLGMSPLAGVGQHYQSFGRERLANLVYQFGSRIYSFEGLYHYKNKFAQQWTPRYIAYSRKSNIWMVLLGLLKIDNKGVDQAPGLED
ncbi:bifunctional lysylphosphatidylglycerol flippase/synthetase MprF [Leuconostocaceae bacterium ESL0723]|nr:bifunctional lysylphosphatidylglycerol flippase/synthetase MprF [Leuconostocaceae bacterium ESL0723]